MTTRRTSRGPWQGATLLGWIMLCAAALVALWSIRDTRFAPPPVEPGLWLTWWEGRDPLDSAASICRLAASVALSYLLFAATVLLVSRFLRSPRLTRFAARLNPAPVAGLAAVAAISAAPAAGASHSVGADNEGFVVEPGASATDDTEADRSAGMVLTEDLPTMTLVDDGLPEPPLPAGPSPEQAPPPSPAESPARAQLVVQVRPGDHLWAISQRRVEFAIGRQPTNAEVHDYWVALIEANSDRLVEPGNPNLVLPGQELVLPG